MNRIVQPTFFGVIRTSWRVGFPAGVVPQNHAQAFPAGVTMLERLDDQGIVGGRLG